MSNVSKRISRVDEIFQNAMLAVERVAKEVPRDRGIVEFEQAQLAIEALPLASAEFCVSSNRLSNARHYASCGEINAALFELKLLVNQLKRASS